ncbi:hypothetical protein HCH_00976 [Hahella chejuensis KCTC 2396]|uniref:Uncharacterized protein n=1 Tax=Hahella chejuensis (strain KCTC 2396) TaxID=349521 RepID=Q2SNB1_HAHCH|nr:hypothetical protein HCH_00976 [Hahella chejuensis KCTC 2396]
MEPAASMRGDDMKEERPRLHGSYPKINAFSFAFSELPGS